MSMSTTVTGFAPPDEKWKQMKTIRDACVAAKIEIPEEVNDFFDDQEPDPQGVEIELETTEWNNDYGQGYELEVSKIPPQCKVLRFYNSW